MRRGDIYWALLEPRSGSEQRGNRPVIVVSNPEFFAPSWRTLIVVPLSTSGSQARRGPTAVALEEGTGNLSQASVALCHQVTTLDRSKLREPIGSLPAEALDRVEAGLKTAMVLP